MRYVDNSTGEYLPEQYGRCDRSGHYHLNPYKDGYAKSHGIRKRALYSGRFKSTTSSLPTNPLVHIPLNVLLETLADPTGNNFFNNLMSRVEYPLPQKDLDKIIELYLLGTIHAKRRKDAILDGAVTFPYFESLDKIHAIQIVQYDYGNHRKSINWIDTFLSPVETSTVPVEFPAVKRKSIPINWIEDRRDQRKVNCFFGAHLVKMFPSNPIILVEGPKSAIIGMLYFGFPDEHYKNPIWLATGSKDYFTQDRAKVLVGRKVIIFPDLSPNGITFKEWKDKTERYQSSLPWSRITVSDYFENNSTYHEKCEKLDIADFLIERDWRLFRDGHVQAVSIREPLAQSESSFIAPNSVNHKPAIKELDSFHKSIESFPSEIKGKLYLLASMGFEVDKDGIEQFSTESNQYLRDEGTWSQEIQELDAFFHNVKLPSTSFFLNKYTHISNFKAFVEYNLEVARAQNGNPTYRPYLNRAIEVMKFLQRI